MSTNSYTFVLSEEERVLLTNELRTGNYVPCEVPYTTIAVKAPSYPCIVSLYQKGKCLVQGKGARDFVEFILEPRVLKRVVLTPEGASTAPATAASNGHGGGVSPEEFLPHVGVDESGKGDYFGPLVVAAVYSDATLEPKLREAGACDSKSIHSDKKACEIAAKIRDVLGEGRYYVSVYTPAAYNRVYARDRSVAKILAHAHATALSQVLAHEPACRLALSDQFGTEDAVRSVLVANGWGAVETHSRPYAENDVAVAAASLLAREAFLNGMAALSAQFGVTLPKGASIVRGAAEELVRMHGPKVLLNATKCHFRTTDQVLAVFGKTRMDLPVEGQVKSIEYKKR